MSVAGRRPLLARRRRTATLALGVLGVCSRPAFAQGENSARTSAPVVALAWSGPGPELTCLGEEGLARAVSDYLGHDAFSGASAELVLHVAVERKPDRTWRALLEVRDQSNAVLGSRVLASSAELCSSLNEPLTLAVALVVGSEPEPEPERVPPPAPEPEPEPESPPTPPPRPAAHSGRRVSMDASVLAETGLLPAPRPGLELGVELGVTSWLAARVSGSGFLPAQADLQGSAHASLALIYGNLALCPLLELSWRWRLGACAGAAFGALLAQSGGLEGARDTRRPVVGLALELRASVRLGKRWSVFCKFGGIVPSRPERFVYELNGERVQFFSMAAFAPVAGIGGSVMF